MRGLAPAIGVCVALLVVVPAMAIENDIEIAADCYRNGLNDRAKSILVDVIHGKQAPEAKAKAYQLLGEIAYSEKKFSVAIGNWNDLVWKFPNSTTAKLTKERLTRLKDMLKVVEGDQIENYTARTYVENGDFYTDLGDKPFTLDTSYLEKESLAIGWYERVINEFPHSQAAEIAGAREIKVLLSRWHKIREERLSEARESWEKLRILRDRSQLETDILAALPVYNGLARDFPDSKFIPALRYQFGQAYWLANRNTEAQKWFQQVIDAGPEDSFYVNLAKARVNNLEKPQ